MTEKLDNIDILQDFIGLETPESKSRAIFLLAEKTKELCQAVDELRSKKEPCDEDPLSCVKEKKYLKGWEAVKALSEGKKIRNAYNDQILKDGAVWVTSLLWEVWEIVE